MNCMKAYSTHQEILLITGTSFSSREIQENNDTSGKKNLSEIERLEKACWNGLVLEMLPEIVMKSATDKDLYLWEVKEGSSFLELHYGDVPTESETQFSIDPYAFLKSQILS